MSPAKRVTRDSYAIQFSHDGERVFTCGIYVSAWHVPTLERLYRLHRRPASVSAALQPGGSLMLARYSDGTLDLLHSVTGELITSCEIAISFMPGPFGLSACGEFAIVAQPEHIAVVELASGKVVWKHEQRAYQVIPLNSGREWAFALTSPAPGPHEERLEIWPWPFGSAAQRTLKIPHSWNLDIQGDRLVVDETRTMSVLDLNGGRQIFSVPKGQARPHWRHDGSLILTWQDSLEVYDANGARIMAVSAPGLWPNGPAFSPVRDDALLSYMDGIVMIRDFSIYMKAHTDLTMPFEQREREPEVAPDIEVEIDAPDERRAVSARTPDKLLAALAMFKRPAWKPHSKSEAGPITGSKFGGIPWLSVDEDWPRCGQCGSLMDLWLQFNSWDLPSECAGLFDGLLQVFACERDGYLDGPCLSGRPLSNAAVVRVCRANGPPKHTELADADLFAERRIVGWVMHEELPDTQELEILGIDLSPKQEKILKGGAPFATFEGDKLMGWPAWQQRPERDACPKCETEMRRIFQINSWSGAPVTLGGGGRGWVLQCPVHRDVVALHWTF